MPDKPQNSQAGGPGGQGPRNGWTLRLTLITLIASVLGGLIAGAVLSRQFGGWVRDPCHERYGGWWAVCCTVGVDCTVDPGLGKAYDPNAVPSLTEVQNTCDGRCLGLRLAGAGCRGTGAEACATYDKECGSPSAAECAGGAMRMYVSPSVLNPRVPSDN